jgi:hypothetical protein
LRGSIHQLLRCQSYFEGWSELARVFWLFWGGATLEFSLSWEWM